MSEKRTYKMSVEVWEGEKLIKKVHECSNNEGVDDEDEIALLLCKIINWAGACNNEVVPAYLVAYICSSVATGVRLYKSPFYELGRAYRDWHGHHDFSTCVNVTVDKERLVCDRDCRECAGKAPVEHP